MLDELSPPKKNAIINKMTIAKIPAPFLISKMGSSEAEIRLSIINMNAMHKAEIAMMTLSKTDIVDEYNLYGTVSQPRFIGTGY